MDTLTKRLKALEAKARERAAQQQPVASPAPAKVVQLPLWPDSTRGVPNAVLRSALFGVIKRGKRAYVEGRELASIEGLKVIFTGPRLDQADLDVWEQCLHLARTEALGNCIQFPAYGFLRSIGRSTGKTQHEWLRNAFRRLAASVVEIEDGKRAYFGQLIHGGVRDKETGLYVIKLNPEIIKLYGKDGWTQAEWQQRLALKGQPLAQWLQGFYSTHAKPHGYKVETIHRLCGSEAGVISDFKKDLRRALARLKVATGWGWEIDDNDLVYITKTPTNSQRRHLYKKARHSTPGGTA